MSSRRFGWSGPPAWLVIFVAALLVFGAYFVWNGVRSYLSGSFTAIGQATRQVEATATAGVLPTSDSRFTPPPTRTPIPECQDFVVIVPEAIVRQCPSRNCPVMETRRQAESICVLQRDPANDEWFAVDLDDSPFFVTIGYMHESLLRAVNPTPTPTRTGTPIPTVTDFPSNTPLPTPLPSRPSDSPVPPTLTPTPTASPTLPLVSG